ncbi:MAG: GntP family permease [Intestinibacter sp.]|uniref:GntP family permease n=1 Tax=Intestinibacter sp. TaxID=1965304 RepID=UPI0025BA1B06|nr:SLC13 family permease [Intestinibacter sp.]MCI6738773.1 GntP family permease [Intestinibacter sp.]
MISGYGLLIVFAISILILLISIIKFKLNPFIALLLTSILTGFLVRMPIGDISSTISAGFGNTLGSIGIVIGLGIVFGNVLSESKATQSIANGLLSKTGDKNAAIAVTTAGFLISIPVYMDAAFVIMMPIVKYIADKTKKSLMIFICALGVGTIVGHAMVIPTPGPLSVAANMNADVGAFIFYSILCAFPAILVGGWLYGKRFNKAEAFKMDKSEAEVAATATESDENIPSFGLSMFTLLFPICIILLSNVVKAVLPADSMVVSVASFLGDKNIALLIGSVVAFALLHSYFEKSFSEVVIEAADSAGLILLITGAGGVGLSLPNDSGFWVLSRFGGISVKDTLNSWTIGGTLAGFSAFAVVLILNVLNSVIGLPGL